jgi:hypothetical protein
MALVSQGNALTSKFVQAGGVYQTDGYGLLTGKATYIVDRTVGGTAVVGGQVHPQYSDMYVHKFTLTRGALTLDTIDADYVGVDTVASGGDMTRPNITASHGLTSEHITTHPNFFGPSTGFSTAIAGSGTTFTTSAINPDYKVGGTFGAHFKGTATNAGGFVGFLDSSTASMQYFYGKSHYLAPITSFSGCVYTTSSAKLALLRANVGKTSGTNSFAAGCVLLPDHVGTTWTATIKGTSRNTIMLSQVSFEDYAVQSGGVPRIFKINYEIRFNREGYPAEVYQGV